MRTAILKGKDLPVNAPQEDSLAEQLQGLRFVIAKLMAEQRWVPMITEKHSMGIVERPGPKGIIDKLASNYTPVFEGPGHTIQIV